MILFDLLNNILTMKSNLSEPLLLPRLLPKIKHALELYKYFCITLFNK